MRYDPVNLWVFAFCTNNNERKSTTITKMEASVNAWVFIFMYLYWYKLTFCSIFGKVEFLKNMCVIYKKGATIKNKFRKLML